MFCSEQKRLVLQFHITGKCNLRCKHCYRTEGDVENLTLNDIIKVIDQLILLREKYNASHGIKKRAHINLTGGEPLYRSDFKEIIQYIHEHRKELTYGVLTNGSFIDDEIIRLFKETDVSSVQLSIDGNKKIHNELRALGDYERVFCMAEKLEKCGIKTHISFTANKKNYKYLPKIAAECRKRKITRLWTDRLVPIGNGRTIEELKITKKEMPEYIKALKRAQGNFIIKKLYPKTEVFQGRALQFQGMEKDIYSCSAAKSFITVDEFGQIMPCRRMPIICGNIFDNTLEEIYYHNEIFLDLRKEKVPKECIKCKYAFLCGGGAKCQSYAEKGQYDCADPACGLAYSEDVL